MGRAGKAVFATDSAPYSCWSSPSFQVVLRLGPRVKRPGETSSQIGCAPEGKDGLITSASSIVRLPLRVDEAHFIDDHIALLCEQGSISSSHLFIT